MVNSTVLRSLVLGAVWTLLSLSPSLAHATLKFYYDPATGNISFDTAGTRSGAVYGYALDANDTAPFHFLPDNLIRLSTGTFFTATPNQIGDGTFGSPWQGLYTIGDILPPGVPEDVWTTGFVYNGSSGRYSYNYADVIGGGDPPPAQFIYGAPAGQFKNRFDLIDPDTLTWAQHATLIYRQWSGEVLVDTTGTDSGYIAGIQLLSNGGFMPAAFATSIDSSLKQIDADNIFIAADAVEPGKYSLGALLPTGLSQSAFESLFTSAKFLGRAGFKGGTFNFATQGVAMNLQFVPEPNALALTVIGCGLTCWRRKWLTA